MFHPQMLTEIKLVGSILGAGSAWIADIAVSASDVAPAWLSEYGLPGIFLALTIYAVRTLFAANQTMQKDALLAKDAQITATEANSKLFLATTEKLIEATNQQTHQLEALTAEIKKCPKQP